MSAMARIGDRITVTGTLALETGGEGSRVHGDAQLSGSHTLADGLCLEQTQTGVLSGEQITERCNLEDDITKIIIRMLENMPLNSLIFYRGSQAKYREKEKF